MSRQSESGPSSRRQAQSESTARGPESTSSYVEQVLDDIRKKAGRMEAEATRAVSAIEGISRGIGSANQAQIESAMSIISESASMFMRIAAFYTSLPSTLHSSQSAIPLSSNSLPPIVEAKFVERREEGQSSAPEYTTTKRVGAVARRARVRNERSSSSRSGESRVGAAEVERREDADERAEAEDVRSEGSEPPQDALDVQQPVEVSVSRMRRVRDDGGIAAAFALQSSEGAGDGRRDDAESPPPARPTSRSLSVSSAGSEATVVTRVSSASVVSSRPGRRIVTPVLSVPSDTPETPLLPGYSAGSSQSVSSPLPIPPRTPVIKRARR